MGQLDFSNTEYLDDIFVGRQKELSIIDRMIQDPKKKKYALRIVGNGGVGKTWLLRSVARKYENQRGYVVIKIDYGESRTHSLPSLANYVFSSIEHLLPDPEANKFKDQLQSVEDLATQSGVNIEKIQEFEKQTLILGVKLVNIVAQNNRIIILSDTVEAASYADLEDRINTLAAKFENAVIIIAGRPTDYVRERFDTYLKIYQDWIVPQLYELTAFSFEESKEYLQRTNKDIDDELSEKIHILTDGKPVLLSFSSEWLRRHIDLPLSINLPIQSLRQKYIKERDELFAIQDEFEAALVEKIRSLGHKIDWALLFLAYFNRRYDSKILRIAMETVEPISEQEVNDITNQIIPMVFVRRSMLSNNGGLHDEACNLINKHAWPTVDPGKALRIKATTAVINSYYLSEIDKLRVISNEKINLELNRNQLDTSNTVDIPDDDWKRQALEIECLDYYFRISDEDGWRYLDVLLTERENYHFAIEAIEATYQTLKLIDKHSPRSKIALARIKILLRDEQKASFYAKEALNASDPNSDKDIIARALRILGKITINPTEKILLSESALVQSKKTGDDQLIAECYDVLGLIYRSQGKWEDAKAQYEEALAYYSKNTNGYASTLNNLAFVTMLSGDPFNAEDMAEKAVQIRKKMGNLRGISLSYSTLGRIAEFRGDVNRASQYYRQALDLAEKVADDDNIRRFRINIASIERIQKRFDAARFQLQLIETRKSKNIITKARALHQATKIERDEAKFLSDTTAMEIMITEKYQKALEYAQEALEFAQKAGEKSVEAGILFDIALIAYFQNMFDIAESNLLKLDKILQEYNFPLEKSRSLELRGDILYLKGEKKPAYEYYLDACMILSSYSPASFEQNYRRLRKKLLEESESDMVKVLFSDLIKTKISDNENNQGLARLINLVRSV